MTLIDKLCYTSKLRYTNAGEKVFFSLASLCFCIISRSILVAVIVLFAASWLTIRKGGISPLYYGKLIRIPCAFLMISTIAILVNISRHPLDAFSIPLGSWYITGSWQGIHQGIQLILTALACVSCLYFLSLSTPLTDIIAVLECWHIPWLIIELMMLIYRFIFLLLEIASSISCSQRSRLGNRDFPTSVKSYALLASSLFILSIRRAGNIYDAMEARCYDGKVHVLKEQHPARQKEILFLILFETFLFLLTIFHTDILEAILKLWR